MVLRNNRAYSVYYSTYALCIVVMDVISSVNS